MKDEKRISSQSRKRNLKYGSLSLAFIVTVTAMVIIVNLLVMKFDQKLDLTNSKVFTLTDETKNIIQQLDDDITITVLERAGSEPSTTSRIAEEYEKASKRIQVEYIDPELNPNLLQKYGDGSHLTFGSIIVENGGIIKTLSPIDLVNLNEDKSKVKAINVEPKLTNALLSVTSKGEKVLYTMVGHGEDEVNAEVKAALENENFIIKEINLLTELLEDKQDGILFINSLKKDISEEEAAKLTGYMNEGGKVLVIDDLYEANRENYEAIFKQSGIKINRSIVFENSMTNRINSDKFIIIPEFSKHPIVDPLIQSNYKSIIAYGQPIEILKVKKDQLEIKPFMTSSQESYSKDPIAITEKKNIDQAADDAAGPFHLGVAITRKKDSEEKPAMVVVTNSFFLNENLLKSSNQANLDMFMNSVHWLHDTEQHHLIRPKDVASSPAEINNFQQIAISILSVFFIPFSIASVGFYYWYRRQKS